MVDQSVVRLHECYRRSFEVEIRGQRRRFSGNVGYYLITLDKDPRVEQGVVTDDDLIRIMKEYFGEEVMNRALAHRR